MSRIKEFQALQYTSMLVKLMDEKGLNMVATGDENIVGLDKLRDPRFGDMLRVAVKMLRKAGHEEEAKTIEAAAADELWPLRYLKLTLRKLPEGQKPDGGAEVKPGDALGFNMDEHERILNHGVVKPS